MFKVTNYEVTTVAWPNDLTNTKHCQSTDGSQLAAEMGFNPTKPLHRVTVLTVGKRLKAKHSVRVPV